MESNIVVMDWNLTSNGNALYGCKSGNFHLGAQASPGRYRGWTGLFYRCHALAGGGIGKVIGAVVGAFLIGVMNNGMSILGIGIDWQQTIKDLVLLLTVFFDVYNKNKNV
ncbi:MAG TPA: hypothetical protein VF918_03015 [Anaerolineales bacterium]